MDTSRLIDRKELLERHPALGRRKHTLNWAIRNRRLPIVRVGRNIFFDEMAIDAWIREQSVKPNGGGR